jgi:hypothetical protein
MPVIQISAELSEADKVAAVAAWVRDSGGPAEIAGNVGILMGLGNGADVAVIIHSFGGPSQKVAIYFCVLKDRSEVVLARRDFEVNRGVYSLLTPDGRLKIVVRAQGKETEVVSGDSYRQATMEILDFFYRHVPA